VVRTDASVRAVGAVIETASGHPCAFYSHPLNSAEQNYPARELEILAVVLVLEEYDHWLARAIIKVMTDHQSLVHLTTCKVNRRLARFLETLLRYNITFCYVRGPTNVVADALSRREDYLGGEGEMTLVEQNSKSFHSYFQQQVAKAEAVSSGASATPSTALALLPTSSASTSPVEQALVTYLLALDSGPTKHQIINLGLPDDLAQSMVAGYEQDPFFSKIYKLLVDLSLPRPADLEPLLLHYYVVSTGLLFRRNPIGADRLCVPQGDPINHMLNAYHTENMHIGVNKTWVSMSSALYWPKMKRDIERFIASCTQCIRSKSDRQRPKGFMRPLPPPEAPGLDWTYDLLTGLPEVDGCDAILALFCRHSKTTNLIATRKTVDAQGVVDLIINRHYPYFGAFRSLTSDRDPRFTSEVYRLLMSRFGIDLKYTTANRPQADGQSERYMSVITEALRANLVSSADPWPQILPFVMFTMNATPHASTGLSPFYINHLREPFVLARHV